MTAEERNTFGALLRHYRKSAGLTQQELAERAGLSDRAISDLERGARTKPWRDTVALLCSALGLTPEQETMLERAITRSRRTTPSAPIHPERDRLPADLTPLLGRESEEAAVVHLLHGENVRLVTLTGTGGVGKTRLALRVAESLTSAYRDGVRFVPLAPLRSPDHVTASIAEAMGLRGIRGETLRATVKNALRGRHLLLLFDNFEHVLDAAPFLGDLLASCPQLSMLVTSREPLHLQGEHEFSVPPLAIPPSVRLPISALALARFPASALLLARARGVHPGIQIGEADAVAIGAICRKLDGLPLAIELAAVHLKYESPQGLLERLERRFDVLIGGPRDVHTRQRTMRDCVAWSYGLLEPDEQDALCQLAVFVGGCSFDAVEAVVEGCGENGTRIRRTVHSLVDKSLLVAHPAMPEGPRFTMLETIREYALERLEERGGTEAAHSAYASYYLQCAESVEHAMWTPAEATWFRQLRAERDNLRTVLVWALDHDIELGLKVGGALRRFWNYDGSFNEWRTWIEKALIWGSATSPRTRAKALAAAGWLALHEGDTAVALDRYHESVAIARSLEDAAMISWSLGGLGLAELSRGAVEAATAVFEEYLQRAKDLDAPELRAPALYGLGLTFQVQGDLERARQHLEESVRVFRQIGETISIGSSLRALGGIALTQGDFSHAQEWFDEALHAARVIEHREGLAMSLQGMAAALAARGDVEHAARLWGAAEAVYDEIYGPALVGTIPFVRLPHLSPHLNALSVHFNTSEWEAARADGYTTPLEDTLALLQGGAGSEQS